MHNLFYRRFLTSHFLLKFNSYNVNKNSLSPPVINLVSTFNTFKGEKSPKLTKLYNLLWYMTNQKPFVKKIGFRFIKKKILKKIVFGVKVSDRNLNNFVVYLSYYLYFYHIYYLKAMKYNFCPQKCFVYLDNIQLSFRQKGKKLSKSHIKVSFSSLNSKFLIFYLNNFFLVWTKTNEISKNKK